MPRRRTHVSKKQELKARVNWLHVKGWETEGGWREEAGSYPVFLLPVFLMLVISDHFS